MGDYANRQPQGYDAEQVLLTAGSVTGNIAAGAGASNEVHIGENVPLEIVLQIRGAVSGTSPTLDIKVQESDTEGGSYSDVAGGAFTQATAAGTERIRVRTTKPWVSVDVTIGGTDTPTFGDTEVFIASPGSR